jgi:phenylacetate-CoA ligase
MMSWVHNNILLPLCQPDANSGLGRRLRALERFDALPRQEQIAVQEKRVRALLDHAYQTCPYSRLIFDEMRFRSVDWHPGDPIPVPELTRELLRVNLENVCSRAFRPDQLRRWQTSGDTTPPIPLWCDLEGLREKTAMQNHLNHLSGYDEGKRVLRIRGADRDLEEHPGRLWLFYEEKLLGRTNCVTGQLSEETFGSLLGKLNAQRSEVLYGCSSTLTLFAKWLRNSGKRWHKPQLIIATAEALSPEQRRTLAGVFECHVTVHYGRRDIGVVAAECPEGGRLHLHPWACYVELLPAGKSPAGPLYRVVVTDLLNYGMPLIRYDTADCVLYDASPCPCGSWYPSITTVVGRTTEIAGDPHLRETRCAAGRPVPATLR